jgi:c-di-GMP-binding flagellar brake protein YcgR
MVPGCQLFIRVPESEKQFTSYLVGRETGRYLIVRTPAPPDSPYRLSESETIRVRYAHMGEIFEFRSSVIKLIQDPFALSFLAYPEQVEHVNLRKFPRISCCIPAALSHQGFSHSGLILDISRSGCRFCLKPGSYMGTLPRVGDNIRIAFPIFDIEGARQFDGTIRNLSTDARGDSLGIEFVGVPPEVAGKIDAYIESALRYSV